MKQILTTILLIYSTISFGQKDKKLSFAFQLQPELTYVSPPLTPSFLTTNSGSSLLLWIIKI